MSQIDNNETNIIYNSSEVHRLFEERFEKHYMEFYESGFYDILNAGWRRLGEEARLEVLQRAFKNGDDTFINEHFATFSTDIISVKNKVYTLSRMYELTDWERNGILSRFKGDRYEGNHSMRELALFSRLKEYSDLSEELKPLSLDVLTRNHRIFRCDASRTASRVKFLQEINPDISNDESKFIDELLMFSGDFNIKYQGELEKKISTLDAATYKAAVMLSFKKGHLKELDEDDKQHFQYDDFLECALKVIYGDKGIQKRIENIKQEHEEWQAMERRVPNAEEPEKLSIIEIFGVLPKGESSNHGSRGPASDDNIKSKKKNLDTDKINEYISLLRVEGIECNEAVVSDAGAKAPGEDYVTYYVFKSGEYRILEAIGQPGNATLVIKLGEGNLKELLEDNSRDELVEKGIAYRMKHKPDENKDYKFNPLRIKNIITLVGETVKRENGQTRLTIDDLITQVTQVVPKEELAVASQYIDQLSRQTAYRYIQKTAEIERKTNPNTVNPSLTRKRGRPYRNENNTIQQDEGEKE